MHAGVVAEISTASPRCTKRLVSVLQGGWGSIEYGTVGFTKGQVLGGRWKPLQHWYKKSIYQDVMATCGSGSHGGGGAGWSCFVNNNAPTPFRGKVTISAIDFATGAESVIHVEPLSMAAGVGVTRAPAPPPPTLSPSSCVPSRPDAAAGRQLPQPPVRRVFEMPIRKSCACGLPGNG